MEDLKERIQQLEKAIRDANQWVKAGEGVDIWYYHQSYGDDSSVNTIKSIVNAPTT